MSETPWVVDAVSATVATPGEVVEVTVRLSVFTEYGTEPSDITDAIGAVLAAVDPEQVAKNRALREAEAERAYAEIAKDLPVNSKRQDETVMVWHSGTDIPENACRACGHSVEGHSGSGLGLCMQGSCGCDGHPDNVKKGK